MNYADEFLLAVQNKFRGVLKTRRKGPAVGMAHVNVVPAPPVFDSRAYDEVSILPGGTTTSSVSASRVEVITTNANSEVKDPKAKSPNKIDREAVLKKMPTARVKSLGHIDRRVSDCPPARWEFGSDGDHEVAMQTYEQKQEQSGCE
jgi:hypothetical protein